MPDRLDVLKTYKLFINGAFPRSESGRSMPLCAGKRVMAHLCKASRKDLRDAVEAARAAADKWAAATAYNRGQILYRMAEMMEGKRRELSEAVACVPAPASKSRRRAVSPEDEVTRSIDRLICFAGWADKYAQVLGCNNPVSGPFYNFTITEPTGVVAVITPDAPPLLGLITLLAPVLSAGNTAVVLAGGPNPIPAAVLGEVCATSDVPAGVVNILTCDRAELLKFVSGHRDIDAVHGANLSAPDATILREGVAENIKRVTIRADVNFIDADCDSARWIEPFVEMKTVWHPASV